MTMTMTPRTDIDSRINNTYIYMYSLFTQISKAQTYYFINFICCHCYGNWKERKKGKKRENSDVPSIARCVNGKVIRDGSYYK